VLFGCYFQLVRYISIWYYELYKYFGTKARDARPRHVSRTSTVHYILNSVHIWNYILYTVPYGKDYDTVPYSTVRYSTVPYGIVQYNTVQCRTVQYGNVRYGTVQ
jgi:hypothetical protein